MFHGCHRRTDVRDLEIQGRELLWNAKICGHKYKCGSARRPIDEGSPKKRRLKELSSIGADHVKIILPQVSSVKENDALVQ